VADKLYRVELTASFLERLDAIEAFLQEADAELSLSPARENHSSRPPWGPSHSWGGPANDLTAFDTLLTELRATVIPNLRRFPRIGRRYLDHPPPLLPHSAEALAQLAALPAGAAHALREYLHGDYLMLYTTTEADATVYLLSIRHHRQLSFDFARLWPGA